MLGGSINAQTKSGSISGIIKTSDGKPAGYVNVGLKSTNKATQTAENGTFTIKNVKPGTYVLKISAIGASTQEQNVTVTAGQASDLNFIIAESSAQLHEVNINSYKSPNKKPVNVGKVAIAPRDLPQAVQVIGTQMIQDQQMNRLSDVLKNVNGVAFGENRGSVNETFFARGYSLGGNNVLKNGARSSSGGLPEASTLESVEVLKGSAALLYGGVSGGAVVNMVTKKPKFEYGGEVSMRAGSYEFYKPTLDLYGPISKKLAFRVIGTYENAYSFRDIVTSKRVYVNPSLLYKVSDKTEIILQGDYLKSNYTPDFGVGSMGNVIPNISRGAFINTPWAYNKTNTVSSQLNVNHKFNDNWKINVIASLQSYNRNYYGAERPAANAAGILLTRMLTRSKTKEFSYNEQINLTGTFQTIGIKHNVLVGLDADQSRTTSNGFVYPSTATSSNPFGLAAYDYGGANLLDPSTYYGSGIEPGAVVKTITFAPTYRMGGFVQDLISVTEKFKVLAGIRWTYQKTPTTHIKDILLNTEPLSTTADKIDKAFSPKVGLIYQPLKATSVYASYSNNFTSNSGTDIFLSPMRPSIIDQYEAGIKNDFLDGKLSANFTVYKIKNSNLAQMALFKADGTSNADATIKEFTGATASDGFEIDLAGTITKGLNFLAGYSYNNYRYTSTLPTGLVEGERLVGTTKNTANGTVFYTFSTGAVKGLKVGASTFYTGRRNGGFNTSKVPPAANSTRAGLIPLNAFTTFDLSAGYTWKQISLLAKISNITDKLNYFVHENYSVNPIPPRQFMTTLAYKF